MDEAVHAASFYQTFQQVKKNPVVKETVGKRKIAQLADNPAWIELKKEIDKAIHDLESMRFIKENDTPESLGLRVMAAQVAIDYLKQVSNAPEFYRAVNTK